MNKRSVDKTSTEDSASKRSAVDDSPEVVPAPPVQTMCMKHLNAIDATKAVTITINASGEDQTVSSLFNVCPNIPCFRCNNSLITGDTVVKLNGRDEYEHVKCSKKGPCELTVQCICHKRKVSVCRTIEVCLNNGNGGNYICDSLVCAECRDRFFVTDKVEVCRGSVYHSRCTIKCAHPLCSQVSPVSSADNTVCDIHTINCVECHRGFSSSSDHVIICSTDYASPHVAFSSAHSTESGYNPLCFLCTACYTKTDYTANPFIVKAPKIFCGDPACEKIHVCRVAVPMAHGMNAAVCAKASCPNCKTGFRYGVGIGYFVDDGKIVCDKCFIPCSFCKKTLLHQHRNREYSGTCATAIDVYSRDTVICPHHATMACEKCPRLICVDLDAGKYYTDVGMWLHHECR